LIASSIGNYKANWNNAIMHKYYDPIIDELEQLNKRGLIISLNRDTQTNYKPNRIKDINNWNYYVRLFKRKAHNKLMEQSEYVRFITELSSDLHTTPTHLELTLNQIFREVLVWKLVYKRLFKKSSPEISICLCYYSWEFYGMNAAANEVKVISIDMQHG